MYHQRRHPNESRGLKSLEAIQAHEARWIFLHKDHKRYGVLYVGVTSDLAERVARHRSGEGGYFTAKYRCTQLVYVEEHPDIVSAIAREKAIKAWKKAWKIEAIEKQNPSWDDLYLKLNM